MNLDNCNISTVKPNPNPIIRLWDDGEGYVFVSYAAGLDPVTRHVAVVTHSIKERSINRLGFTLCKIYQTNEAYEAVIKFIGFFARESGGLNRKTIIGSLTRLAGGRTERVE